MAWIPQAGPQLAAIEADWCDELFYGGERGVVADPTEIDNSRAREERRCHGEVTRGRRPRET